MDLHFIHTVFLQINAVAVVIILMIHMQSYAKLCVPDVIKDMNTQVFNLISRTNKTRHVSWHGTCKCKCKLDAIICNDKQRWNTDKYRCGCKELIDKGRCDNGFIWNPSILDCECDKSCGARQCLNYENCKCRKELIGKIAEECSEDTDESEMIYNATLNDYVKVCKSCTIYIVLLAISFVISISISSSFVYFYGYLKRKGTETVIY